MSRRRLVVLLTGVVIAALLAPLFGGTPAEGEDGSANPAWAAATSCVRQNGILEVQMAIDVSLSLVTSDPDELRKALARSWVRDLASLAAGGSEVRLSIATYGSRWTERMGWHTVDASTVARAYATIDELPRDELDTDHASMLQAASDSLERESARTTGSQKTPCPMLLWFTDGEFDFQNLTTSERESKGLPTSVSYSDLPLSKENERAIEAAGVDAMCRDGGSAKALRDASTAIIAVALGDKDFSLINEVATGDAFADDDGGDGCRLPHYELAIFEPGPTIVDPTTTLPPSTTAPSTESTEPLAACGTGTCILDSTFQVPPLADRVQLDAAVLGTGANAVDGPILKAITLVSPTGESVRLGGVDSGTANGSATTFTVQGSSAGQSRGAVLVTSKEAGALGGEWQVAVETDVDGASLELVTLALSDLRVELRSPEQFEAGTQGELTVRLVTPAGQAPPKPELLDGLAMDLTVTSVTGLGPVEMARLSDGSYTATLPPEATSPAVDTVKVLVLPRLDGIVFQPTQIEVPVVVPGLPRVVFPTESNGVVRPGLLETPGTLRVPYRVVGPSSGEGCVTGRESTFSNDDMSATLGFEVPEDCVRAGSEVERSLSIRFESRQDGTLCGTAEFEISGTETEQTTISRQPICVVVEPSATLCTRILAILATIFGLLLPFFVLGGLNYWNGRLPSPNVVEVATLNININEHGAVRPGAATFLTKDDLVSSHDIQGARRQWEVAGNRIVLQARAVTTPRAAGRGRASLSMLFTGPRKYVRPQPSPLAVGSGSKVIFSGQGSEPIQVSDSVDGLWFVVPRPGHDGRQVDNIPATLVIFREFGQGLTHQELSRQIKKGLEDCCASYRQAARATPNQKPAGEKPAPREW